MPATLRFNNNILVAARRVQSPRSSADAAGDTAGMRYKSADWANYQNRAIRDILSGEFEKLGDAFPHKYPQYVRETGTLTLVGGSVARPADSWHFTDLVSSDGKTIYFKLKDDEIHYIKSGRNPIRKPSVSFPVFWEEGNNIVTLPASANQVTGRYIITHQDIAVVTDAANVNKVNFNTAPGDFDWGARTFTVTMNTGLASPDDVNKRVTMRIADRIFTGFIESVGSPSTGLVVLDGDPPDPGSAICSDFWVGEITSGPTDLQLNANFDGAIVDLMMKYANDDATRAINA